MSGSRDVAAIFRNAGRKKFDCPLCLETGFPGEYKIWEHAKQLHKDCLRDLSSAELEQVKKDFVQAALEKAQTKDPSTSQSAKWAPKAGGVDSKQVIGHSPERPAILPELRAIGSNPDAGNSKKQPLDRRKSAPLVNPLKRGPGSNDILDGPGASEPTTQSLLEGCQSEVPSGVLLAAEDFGVKREDVGANEHGFRPTAVKPKLFDPDKDSPIKSLASRRNKFQGKTNTGHRHNTSKDFKRQASSEVGERQTRPQEFPTPKKILQHDSRDTNAEIPQRFTGQDPFDPCQDKDAMPNDGNEDPEPNIVMLRQPETRPISHDQLVVEVKGIYAGLVMVEAKCIDVDRKQSVRAQEDDLRQEPLKDNQWQSLIALHKQLLHEHHDFFLASQHPSASSNLSKLAAKYSMPARMWRHGIHAFLEVLRHRLPESLEHMLAFIYIAYSMMALLYETVPTFEDTWIECLGDLGRYRMAIEDDEPKDREVWSGVARFWYSKAADKNPTVGRLYHHLAILARPYTLEQLSFYTRSLTCVIPFESARGSIMTLFNPVLNGKEIGYYKSSSMEQLVIKAHGLLFLYPEKPLHELIDVLDELKDRNKRLVEDFIEKSGVRFKRIGVFLAVSNIAALFEFGALTDKWTPRSTLRQAFDRFIKRKSKGLAKAGEPTPTIVESQDLESEISNSHSTILLTTKELEISKVVLSHASDLTFSIFEIALSLTGWERNNILPMVHIMLAFIHSISLIPDAIDLFEKSIPWTAICSYLNSLEIEEGWKDMIWDDRTFPSAAGTTGRPPPDDYIIRGQVYTQDLFPESWFTDAKVDDEERMLEQSSHDAYRTIRVLWLAARICSAKRWLIFDDETKRFNVLGHTTTNLTSTLEARKNSLKGEKLEKRDAMDNLSEGATSDADAMSDVATDETPFKDAVATNAIDSNGPTYRSTSTTRTSVGRTDATDVPTVTIVRQEGSTTPRVNEPEEPEDTPMMDISPGKEHTSFAPATPAKIQQPPWIDTAVADSSLSSPQKAIEGFISDPNAVRILQPEEDLGDSEL